MNRLEIRAVISLGALYALRMLGMFMVLPVLALYAATLPGGASGLQIGWAIGIYGLTQALLQIPLGIASDRYGRKPVIVVGMLIFALGSIIAALSHSIEMITVGRAVQGAGAISAAVAALLADVTRTQVRTTAMAILGMGMGLAFVLALVLGPVLAGVIGVPGIFAMTAVLAVLSIPVVLLGVPSLASPSGEPEVGASRRGRRAVAGAGAGLPLAPSVGEGLKAALLNAELFKLDLGIFILHACMTALFVAAPQAIVHTLNLPSAQHWQVYLPVLLLSLIPVFPLIRWAENRGRMHAVFLGAVICLSLAFALAAQGHAHAAALLGALVLFFAAFNFLEGALPSLISRRVTADQRGAALGVYSTAQFLGGGMGGVLGGVALQHWGIGGVFAMATVLPLIWVCFAFRPAPSGVRDIVTDQ